MSNLPISQLIPPAARAARDDLVAALGTEHIPNQWMQFMATVRRHLPDVLSRGRPSQESIARSIVGQHGFASWREMVEAPRDQLGLGWSWSAWRQWSRAWRVVEDHPWLREQPMTAAQVNALSDKFRQTGVEWPDSAEALEAMQQQLGEQRAQRREEGRAALAARLQELEERVPALEARATELEAARAAAAARVADLEAQADRLKDRTRTAEEAARKVRADLQRATGQLEEARAARDAALSKAAQPRPLPRLTRWQHLVAALLGQ